MANENSNQRNRFAVNTFLSVVTWVFPLLLAFIATPIVVRRLGNNKYGVYAITFAFVSVAFSSGIARISAKYIPEFRSSGKDGEISEIVSATLWLTLIVGVIQALVLVLAAPYIVTDVLLLAAPESTNEVIYALYLASAGGLLLMLSFTFQFVLQGLHRFDSLALIANLSAILLNVGNVVLAIYGYGVRSLLAWNAAVSGFIGVLYYLSSRRALPELRLTFKIRKATVITISKYASSIAVYQALTSLLFIFERTWIVRHFGTETLTFFVIPMTLAVYMHGLIASVVQVLFPVVNELINDRERMIGLYKKATKMVLMVIVFILGTYVSSGRAFLGLWISEEFAQNSYYLLVILSSAMGINAIGIIAWQLTEAFKRPVLNALSTALWLFISVPLMIIAVDRWHSEGVAFARLIGVMATVPIIFYVEKKFLGRFFWGFWLGIICRVGIAALAMAVVESQVFHYTEINLINLFGAVVTGGLVYCGTLLIIGYFSKDELATARDMIFRSRRNAAV